MNATRRITAALATGLVCTALACENGLFAPGAAPGRSAALSINAVAATTGGSANAFDRADALHVRVMRGTQSVLDSTLAFTATGEETRVSVAVELATSPETLGIEAELRSGGSPLFRASASATLKLGETTPVTLALEPVPADVLALAIPTFTAIGDTAWARGAVVFSTGDTIRGAHPTWTSSNPAVVSAGPDSVLVARGEGQAQIQATFGQWVQTVPVTVNAIVTSLAIDPRNPSTQLGDAPVRFTAVPRDRRGNALVRIPTWRSSNPAIAGVDASGLATPVAAGTTFIVASVGAVRDSTQLTVVTLAAPTNLSVAPVSSAQLNLSWTDNTTRASGFRIERCLGSSCTAFADITDLGYWHYRNPDTGVKWGDAYQLSASTAYTYRVRVYNATDTSAYSNVATGTTLPPESTPPDAPTTLTATAVSSSEIDLKWSNGATNETGVQIEQCQGASFVSCTGFTVYDIPFADIWALNIWQYPASTVYVYRARLYNRAGFSAYSNTATATTLSAGPAAADGPVTGIVLWSRACGGGAGLRCAAVRGP